MTDLKPATTLYGFQPQKRGKEEGGHAAFFEWDVTESGIYHSGSHSIGGNLVMWLHSDYQGGCDMSSLDRESYASPKTWAKTWATAIRKKGMMHAGG